MGKNMVAQLVEQNRKDVGILWKNWYITGASTGLGREYAEAALNRGDQVVAVSIDPENMQDYRERYGDRVFVQELDVTDREAVERSTEAEKWKADI